MPKIEQFVSSVDGKTPVENEPVELQWNNQRFTLYLTDAQQAEFQKAVDKVTAYEKPKPIVTKDETSKPGPPPLKEWLDKHNTNSKAVREWARANEDKLNGAKAPKTNKGSISQKIKDAYDANH